MKGPGVRFLLAAGVIFLLLTATPTCAQPDFTAARVAVGDFVSVTVPSSGTTINGPLTALTPATLTVGSREIGHEPGLRIARRGDTLWNGFLIGFGIGAVVGATVGAEGCLDRSLAFCAIGGGAVYGGIGALIDWRRKGFTVVYRETGKSSVRVMPSIGPGGAAVRMLVSF